MRGACAVRRAGGVVRNYVSYEGGDYYTVLGRGTDDDERASYASVGAGRVRGLTIFD